jgi:hypothetical protein
VERAPAARTTTQERAHRVIATRIGFAAAVAAICFGTVSVAAALSHGPSLQQRELLREMAARHGLPIPQGALPAPGFNWVGTITPGAIAVLLVVLIIYLRVHATGADRP